MNVDQTEQHLRHLIFGLLHVGRLRRGDRLPSIRSTANGLGIDHRAVANAYRSLQAEGLVEIRPGSGVYLASEASPDMVDSEAEAWLGAVLLEGWSRRVSRADVAKLVERVATSIIHCAVIESNDDHMLAIGAELEEDFSLEVRPLLVSPDSADPACVPSEALATTDVVVTTVFHAELGLAAAALVGKPCIVVSVNRQFAADVARKLGRREVTAVIADPLYGVRGKAYLEVTPHRGYVRFVLVDDLGTTGGERVDLQSDVVLVTRAARRRLGLPEYHLIPPPPSYISVDSARELFQAIVRLSSGRGGEVSG